MRFRKFYENTNFSSLFETVEELKGCTPYDIFGTGLAGLKEGSYNVEFVTNGCCCDIGDGEDISESSVPTDRDLEKRSTMAVPLDVDGDGDDELVPADDYNDIKKNPDVFHLGNQKIDEVVAIFNMTLAYACPADARGMCKSSECCYAKKAERQYKEITVWPRKRQTIYWSKCTAEEFVNDIKVILKPSTQYLRLNESGDFRNQGDVQKLDTIARMLKKEGIQTYTYTARKDLNFHGVSFRVKSSGYPGLTDNGHCIVIPKGDNPPKGYTLCPGTGCGGSCKLCMNTNKNIAFHNHGGNAATRKLVEERYRPIYDPSVKEGEGRFFMLLGKSEQIGDFTIKQNAKGQYVVIGMRSNTHVKVADAEKFYSPEEAMEFFNLHKNEIRITGRGIDREEVLNDVGVYDIRNYESDMRRKEKMSAVGVARQQKDLNPLPIPKKDKEDSVEG